MTQHRHEYIKARTPEGRPITKVGRFGVYVDEKKVLALLAEKAAKNKGKASRIGKGAIVVEYFGDYES